MTEHSWVWIAKVADVPAREGRSVTVGGRELAVFNLGGGRFAVTDGRCPHKGGPLADGIVSGDTVVCPLHAWKIRVTTGDVCRPADAVGCVETYPVRIDNDVIVVGLPSDSLRDGTAA